MGNVWRFGTQNTQNTQIVIVSAESARSAWKINSVVFFFYPIRTSDISSGFMVSSYERGKEKWGLMATHFVFKNLFNSGYSKQNTLLWNLP